MRALNIIVEGPSEREFIKACLMPYFYDNEIYNVRTIGIETSPGFKGGDMRYARFKPNVLKLLNGSEDMLVTSLIDFYQLRSDFPSFEESKKQADRVKQLEFLERSCFEDINDDRFIPYIQLHEFEGLLFTKMDGFEDFNLPKSNKDEIQKLIDAYDNPEFINDGYEAAPSKRLMNLIPNYQKPFHGAYIAHANGIDSVLNKCNRFNGWVEVLVKRMKA